METPRVFVTGAGVVSAAGEGREQLWQGLQSSAPASCRRTVGMDDGERSCACACASGFNVEEYLETPKAYLDRSSQFALAGASLALEDADLDRSVLAGDERVGLMLGSACGNMETMDLFFSDVLAKGPRFAKPFLFPHAYANTSISLLAIEYGILGPHLHFASGWVASGDALVAAFDEIRGGRADLVLAGGFEALSDPWLKNLAASQTLCGSEKGCAPFDLESAGLMPGEGCAILVLESGEHARARGAQPLAELRGAAAAGTDAELSAGNGSAMLQAMLQAVGQAGLETDEIDWVCARANGCASFDRQERMALQSFAGQRARPLPVSSPQSRTGETFGAGSALRAAAAIAALRTGTAPGTANLSDTACAEADGSLNFLTGRGLQADIGNVLVNSGDPGGAALSMVLGCPPRPAAGKEPKR